MDDRQNGGTPLEDTPLEATAEEQGSLVPIETTAVVVAEKPKDLSEEDDTELKARVESLITDLRDGNRELEAGLKTLGSGAQREAAGKIKLLQAPLRTMMKEDGPSQKIGTGLIELRETMEELNPNTLAEPKWYHQIPIIGRLLGSRNLVTRALSKIRAGYEPLTAQKDAIILSLREGEEQIVHDNMELDTLYTSVEEQQLVVAKNAYLGELLIEKLTRMHEEETDPVRKGEIQSLLHAVSMRTQDLRVMLEANMQFFVSIRLTQDNNHSLAQTVARTIDMVDAMLSVALAIQMALANQKRVMGQVRASQEMLGGLMTQTAATVKTQGGEIAEMANNPVIALDMVKQAHDDLIEAIANTENVKADGIAAAAQGIGQLKSWTDEMEGKVKALSAARTGTISEGGEEPTKSIEA